MSADVDRGRRGDKGDHGWRKRRMLNSRTRHLPHGQSALWEEPCLWERRPQVFQDAGEMVASGHCHRWPLRGLVVSQVQWTRVNKEGDCDRIPGQAPSNGNETRRSNCGYLTLLQFLRAQMWAPKVVVASSSSSQVVVSTTGAMKHSSCYT